MLRRDALKILGSAPAALSLPSSFLASAPDARAARRFEASWQSIDSRPSPGWYTDAKFGIFIHWGVYSVPAFAAVNTKGETGYAEWYWNSLPKNKRTNGPTWKIHQRVYAADFPYFHFAPMFRAELYDPDHWADVFERAGAK